MDEDDYASRAALMSWQDQDLRADFGKGPRDGWGGAVLGAPKGGMIEGTVHHSCRHGHGPHRIKVCIIKSTIKSIDLRSKRASRCEHRISGAQQARP